MKVDIGQLSKLYYSIGEVADLFDVNRSLLRYWEGEFKQLKPRKKGRGSRLYTKEDILLINRIYDLLKTKGYTIEGARKALKEDRSPAEGATSPRLVEGRKKVLSALHKLKTIRKQLD